MKELQIKFKKLEQHAQIPTRATDGAACYDLYTTGVKQESKYDTTYGTGIALEIPKGYVCLIFQRSSYTRITKQLSNCVGVIDSDYRGEILVKIRDTGSHEFWDMITGRIAQMMIIKHEIIEFKEVKELSKTKRGKGGFGHTGKK
jgi:dUTP pyrophosphatase